MDSGYPNRSGYLTPYRGTKYHLPHPRGKKEIFNYNHSSLRNVIERSFGVLKTKWRILKGLPSYPMPKQSKIITACMALNNFIREHAMEDDEFDKCDDDESYDSQNDGGASTSRARANTSRHGEEDRTMNAFRDWIADGLSTRQ